MFYPSDILRKRGKFGFIWLASTKAKRLHRRQICSVDVVEASEDIMDVLTEHHLSGVGRRVYFSLYLSSQLVSGLVHIADMQTRFLLEDLKAIVLKLGDKKKPSIDLNKTLSKAKVTLKEFDMDDALLDFGCFNPPPEPSSHLPSSSYDQYFLITTPKSSEASPPHLHRSIPEVARQEESSSHLARREDITLADAEALFQSEEPIPELEEIADLFAPPLQFTLPHTTGIESIQTVDHDVLPSPCNAEEAIFLTPKAAAAGEERNVVPLMQTPEPSPDEHTADNGSSSCFVLPFIVPDRKRRKRKGRFLVDAVISLTNDQMKKNISSTSTAPLFIPSTVESAKSLMTRLGSGDLVPMPILKRFKMLKTLPEDISKEEEKDELMSPVESRILVSESIEQERSKTKDRSGSGFLKSASLKTLEASSTLSATVRPEENIKSPSHFIQEEDYDILHSKSAPGIESLISEARFSTPLVNVDTPDLLPEIDNQQPDERAQQNQWAEKKSCKDCSVSPERTPPPSSHISLHEILEEALGLIAEAVLASRVPNYTTFSAMLLLVADITRGRVASLFNSLLCLHAEGKIFLQQPGDKSEIFIELQS